MKKWLHRLVLSVDHFLAPPLCMRCQQEGAQETSDGFFLCRACSELVQPIPSAVPRCAVCGGPRGSSSLETCFECSGQLHPWSCGVSVFRYHGEGGSLLRQFKYNGRTELAAFFGVMMARAWREHGRGFSPQVIVPVPLHWRRMIARGFNQSELLAGQLGRLLKIPVWNALCRCSSTAHQARLNAKERLKNLSGCFSVKESVRIKGLRVLLLDDVYTTGATLTACAAALEAAGSGEIGIITVARA